MSDDRDAGPESTAVRVALWRAMHVLVDSPPHVLVDEVGLRLIDPPDDWRSRPDMDPTGTSGFRAAIVARARFIEDLLSEQVDSGVDQCVILGAGLDTFAQRRPDIAAGIRVFEVDKPRPQAWKRRRLAELGIGVPDWLRFVSANFETQSWWAQLVESGFDADRPTCEQTLSARVGTDAAAYVTVDQHDRPIAAAFGLIDHRLPSPRRPTGDIGYVEWLVTDPAHRRQGAAGAAMAALLEWFAPRVSVVDVHASASAAPLYAKLGFDRPASTALRLRLPT